MELISSEKQNSKVSLEVAMIGKMTPAQEERRQRILEAAGRYFGKNGYHLADLDVVSKEAGVGKGTLYRYFENKEQLFIEVVSYFSEKMYGDIISDVEKAGDRNLVKALFEAHERYYSKHREVYNLVHKAVTQMPEKLVSIFHAVHDEKMNELRKRLEKGMEKGVFKKMNVQIVLKILDAMANMIFLTKESDSKFSVNEIKDTFEKVFNEGILV